MSGLNEADDGRKPAARKPGRPPTPPNQAELDPAVYAWTVCMRELLDRFGNQKQQAAAVGYDQSRISRWRRGLEVPRRDALRTICGKVWKDKPVTDGVRAYVKGLHMAALRAMHPDIHDRYLLADERDMETERVRVAEITIQKLSREKDELLNDLREADRNVEDLTRRLHEADAANTTLKTTLHQARQQAAESKRRLGELQLAIAESSAERDAASRRADELLEQLIHAQKERDSLQAREESAPALAPSTSTLAVASNNPRQRPHTRSNQQIASTSSTRPPAEETHPPRGVRRRFGNRATAVETPPPSHEKTSGWLDRTSDWLERVLTPSPKAQETKEVKETRIKPGQLRRYYPPDNRYMTLRVMEDQLEYERFRRGDFDWYLGNRSPNR